MSCWYLITWILILQHVARPQLLFKTVDQEFVNPCFCKVCACQTSTIVFPGYSPRPRISLTSLDHSYISLCLLTLEKHSHRHLPSKSKEPLLLRHFFFQIHLVLPWVDDSVDFAVRTPFLLPLLSTESFPE